MDVLLVQHGEATTKDVDPDRPLTEKGKQDVNKVARFLSGSGWSCVAVYHSGKLRAEQTADLLGQLAFHDASVEAVDGIGPKDDVAPVASSLTGQTDNVAYVGHLPFMARLAGQLLVGDPASEPVEFQNGGGVCIGFDGVRWRVRFMIVPELL